VLGGSAGLPTNPPAGTATLSSTTTALDLAGVLQALELGEYGAALRSEGFGHVADLVDVSVDELRSIGFKLGHAKKLAKAVAAADIPFRAGGSGGGSGGSSSSSTVRPHPPSHNSRVVGAGAPAVPTVSTLTTALPTSATDGGSADDKTKCKFCKGDLHGDAIEAIGALFHPKCFCCYACMTPLEGKGFKADTGNPYCSPCWHTRFGMQCEKCFKPILPDPVTGSIPYLNVSGKQLHKACWACDQCRLPFGQGADQGAFSVAGRTLCKTCGELAIKRKAATTASLCHKCHQPLLPDPGTGVVQYMSVGGDKKLHKRCWVCDECRAPFGEGEKQGAYVVGARSLCWTCSAP
jgi:hypothetical protein